MKFDKRYIFAASLVLAMGLGTFGCSDDDDKDKGDNTAEVTACDGENMVKDGDDCKCKEGYKKEGDKCVKDSGDEQPATCEGDHKIKDGDGCKCEDGYELNGDNCVEKQGDTPAVCEGDHKIKDGDGCKCEEGYKMEGDSCVEEGGEQPADCTGEHMKKDADGECVCDEGYKLEGGSCVEKGGSDKPETCGNNKLDDGEICDIVDGAEQFAEGQGTCDKWAAENEEELDSEKEQGKPGCATNCLAHSMNPKSGTGCFSKASALCGNGKIDVEAGEVCDIGVDKTKNTDDDVVTGATCKDWQEGTYTSGTPGCAKSCKEYAKGTCVAEGEEPAGDVNGIVSCKATITIADKKATGSAEVVAKDGKKISGAIICGADTAALNSLVQDAELSDPAEGKLTNTTDISAFKDNGNYGCFYYVKAEGKDSGVFCSAEGTVTKDTSQSVSDVKLASFNIENDVVEGTVAIWNFNTYQTSNKTQIATDLTSATGMAPDEGSSLSLKWNALTGIDVTPTVTVAGSSSKTSALQLANKDTTNGNWAETQTKSTNANLSIEGLKEYNITKLNMNAMYGKTGETFYITGETASSESLIKEVKPNANAYTSIDITENIPADIVTIRIYGKKGIGSALNFDDISVFGAKK